MSSIFFLALLWLLFYGAIYALIGARVGQWLGGKAPRLSGPLTSGLMALAALACAVGTLAVLGSRTSPAHVGSGSSLGLGLIVDGVGGFVMGVATSVIGNLLTARR